MCHVIDSQTILANELLHNNRGVTVQRLKEIQKRIESESLDVFVDVSSQSVWYAVHAYSRMFEWKGDQIARAPGSEQYYKQTYIHAFFNGWLPPFAKDTMLSVLLA